MIVLINPNNIPFDTNSPQWVLYIYEVVDGRRIKVPYHTNGKRADLTNPESLEKLEDVCKVAEFFDGIGFVSTPNSRIMDHDFDQVKEITEWDSEAIYELQSLGLCAKYSQRRKRIYVYENGKTPGTWKIFDTCRIFDIESFSSVTGEQMSEVLDSIDKKVKDINKLNKLYSIVEGPLLEPNKDRCLIINGTVIPNSVLKKIRKTKIELEDRTYTLQKVMEIIDQLDPAKTDLRHVI